MLKSAEHTFSKYQQLPEACIHSLRPDWSLLVTAYWSRCDIFRSATALPQPQSWIKWPRLGAQLEAIHTDKSQLQKAGYAAFGHVFILSIALIREKHLVYKFCAGLEVLKFVCLLYNLFSQNIAGLICYSVFFAAFSLKTRHTQRRRIVCGDKHPILGTVLRNHIRSFYTSLDPQDVS